ncbi:hypothetical protein GCM10023169_31880 [Georgenia halophila]|uniref:HTH tetR-type domain-containing protein n=1 Tax=Georgenia halophila TaxID=620889 RepID=A0ABP8LJB9_9MICO
MTQSAALAQQEPTADPRRGPGRPRHTDTEPRAYRAALDLFGRRGWSGLTLDGVATHAGIGKSSIYLRWKDKRQLLLEAVRDLQTHLDRPETDGLGIRDYLIAHARARADLFLGEHGPALANLYSAVVADREDFAEVCEEDITRGMRALAPRVERAVTDGELAEGTPVVALLDAIEGAIFFHVVLMPDARSPDEVKAGLGQYVATVVDVQLRGVPR